MRRRKEVRTEETPHRLSLQNTMSRVSVSRVRRLAKRNIIIIVYENRRIRYVDAFGAGYRGKDADRFRDGALINMIKQVDHSPLGQLDS